MLNSADLKKHASCLFILLENGFTHKWGSIRDDLENLAASLDSYACFLIDESKNQQERHHLEYPVRQLKENVYISTHASTAVVETKYMHLSNELEKSCEYEPVFFDEDMHLEKPFESRTERSRFLQNLHLQVPVDVLRYDVYSSSLFLK